MSGIAVPEDRAAAADRAAELRTSIAHHRKRYYVDNDPEIGDTEYDLLERELLAIEAQFPELRTADSPSLRVGGQPSQDFPSFEHPRPLLSLDNAYGPDELREWEARLIRVLGDRARRYVAEAKIDGFSLAVHYRDGVLERAVTRGNGRVGDEVTANARTIAAIPLRLTEAVARLEARCEVFMARGSFDQLNAERLESGEEPFANPRNAAAGSIRMLDPKVVAARKLDCFFYELTSIEGQAAPTRHAEGLDRLRSLGLRTNPLNEGHDGLEGVIDFFERVGAMRDGLDYEIDGIVVKLDELAGREIAGATSKFPRWAIAVKYPAQQAATRVERIVVQVGRTGKLTPGGGVAAGGPGRHDGLAGDAAQRRRGRPQGRACRRHGPGGKSRRDHPASRQGRPRQATRLGEAVPDA